MTTTRYADGTVAHYDDDHQLHRVDGPALEAADGTESWYLTGQLHRVDGPAVTNPDSTTEYWVHGARIPRTEQHLLEQLTRDGKPHVLAEVLRRWEPETRLAELVDTVSAELPELPPAEPTTEHTGRFTWRPADPHQH